jgi:hypothetical protein
MNKQTATTALLVQNAQRSSQPTYSPLILFDCVVVTPTKSVIQIFKRQEDAQSNLYGKFHYEI